ncbi:MAG: two-component regulator propeller domain-containing protein [Bacteroidia bacterium]|nr:hypothetical protein [Bacteroidia bacterium]MDW8158580.1 two-component regulator propeller domain-containing protein [Bacteroidia bacterium]
MLLFFWIKQFILCFFYVQAQPLLDTQIGEWKVYVSHNAGRGVAIRNTTAYMISGVGMVSYNLKTGEYREYTRLNGLSDTEPTTIYYDAIHDYIVIGYASGLLDYFRTPEKIYTIRDIFLSRNVIDKKINYLYAYQDYLYIATNFGLVVYDISSPDVRKRETRFSYFKIGNNNPFKPILAQTVYNNRLWVIVEGSGVHSASLTHPNLADAAAWQLENTGLSIGSTRLLATGGNALFCNVVDTIFRYDIATQSWQRQNPQGIRLRRLQAFVSSPKGLYVLGLHEVNIISPDSTREIMSFISPTALAINEKEGFYAIADNGGGIHVCKGNKVLFYRRVELPSNRIQDITICGQELLVAPGGYSTNYAPTYDPTGIYIYKPGETEWFIMNKANGRLDPKRANLSFGFLYCDPYLESIWCSSWDNGIIRIKNKKLEEIYDNQNPASCLTGILTDTAGKPLAIRVAGIQRDKKNNLWLSTFSATRPIAVITPEGKCYNYPSPIPNNSLMNVLVDDYNNKWFIVNRNGILVFNEGEEIPKGDIKSRWLRAAPGRGNLPSDFVNVLAKDKNGSIWVGSSSGIAVFYNTFSIFDANALDAICPVYNFRCLLKEENITAIAIDGANRKWIGTAASGVFLFSPDGTEELAHFNTQNSPLLSDKIIDIEIDPETGIVYIATQAGLMSYRGEATEAKSEIHSTKAYVFPNPILTSYEGPIAIKGSSANATIKITTVAGTLVRELKSLGGQTIWDGKDSNGNKVTPGVYIVLFSDAEGQNAGMTKFAVIQP